MTINCILVAAALITVVLDTSAVRAQQHKDSDNFIDSEPINRPPPSYPYSQRTSENGGMVEVAFMVDTTGKPYEPMVLSSTHKSFESFTLEAVKKYTYSPATLNGKPVGSFQTVRVMFEMENAVDKVSPEFAAYYRSVEKELVKTSPNQRRVASKIKKMERSGFLSAYAHGLLNFARFKYAYHFGDQEMQINAINELLLFEGGTGTDGKFLDDGIRLSMRRTLVSLYIQTQRYGAALKAYSQLTKIDPDAKKVYGEAVQKIHALAKNDQVTVVQLKIHKRGYAADYLFKNTFALIDVNGVIENLKLRCDNRFSELAYSAESEYQVPKGWGKCHLQVIGDPGTTAGLAQY